MSQGPSLIFDKSALESLNLDEAVLLDNFYRSNITPLFFVECLADLEKAIRSRSTPEQLVGSLALRTPESQSCATAHHTKVLANELARKFDLSQVLERPMVPYGQPVQLGDKKGIVFRRSPEEEALQRWTHHEFLEVERGFAKQWRNALMRVNHDDLVKTVMVGIGHWRKPKSLEDAKQMTDYIYRQHGPGMACRLRPQIARSARGNAVRSRRLDGKAEAPDPPAFALFHLHAVDQYFLHPHHPDPAPTQRQAEPSDRSRLSLIIYLSARCSLQNTASTRRSSRYFSIRDRHL